MLEKKFALGFLHGCNAGLFPRQFVASNYALWVQILSAVIERHFEIQYLSGTPLQLLAALAPGAPKFCHILKRFPCRDFGLA